MSMQNKTYDVLKYIALIVLPALGALYFALAKIWGFPYGTEVVGTIAAIDVFLGELLRLSSNKYYSEGKDIDGTLAINGDDETLMINFDDMSFEELVDKKVAKVKVDYQGKHEA